MTQPPAQYLFVYGTLLQGFTNEFALLLKDNSKFVGYGFFNGNLYDFGDYPGAKRRDKAEGKVIGQVFEINDPENILPQLDFYEGVGEPFPAPQEYKRELIPIHLEEDGILDCWVYLYNWKATGRKKVHSGNYPDYLSDQKL